MKKNQPPQTGDNFRNNQELRVLKDPPEQKQAIVLNDESIIRQVLQNDPQAGYDMLFRRYYRPLCSHAARFLYSKETAEDVVSEVFLNFWKNKLYENVNSTYKTYLYTAVRNNAYNYLKKEFRTRDLKENFSEVNIKLRESSDPQSILLLDELFSKVEKSINSFPPQCQRVFLLSRFEGKKNKEIAETMNLKLKTVEAHMMKALSTLKKSLEFYLG